jgi:arginyl-tRNA synthetase
LFNIHAKFTKIIGLGAIRFFILKTDPSKDMLYDPEASVSFEGETGPYVQYTYARLASILRKGIKTKKIDFSKFSMDIEQDIIKQLSLYPRTVSEATYKPHLIARYLLDLSQSVNEFYHSCPILKAEKSIRDARLFLIEAVKTILRSGLKLLDIQVLEVM